jgi:hypothetical protein
MLKKLPLIFLLLGTAVLCYFAYPIVKSRYLRQNTESSQKNIQNNETSDDLDSDSETEDISDEKLAEIEKSDNADGSLLNITKEDCDNECKDYEEAGDLKYCQETCGLNKAQSTQKSDCESLDGLNKDYCFKNQAIDQNSSKICDKINDKTIKKTCRNRIAEDLLDKSGLAE